MKKINNLEERLKSNDFVPALREMGIPELVIKLFIEPNTLTEEELEEVTKHEDGDV